MYKWYIEIDYNGKNEVIRSNADTLEEAKKEIEEKYPGFKYLGHIELKNICQGT